MRVIVTGGGAIGRHLSADLAERGHDVTLIEQDRSVVDRLREEIPDVKVMLGDACEPRILEEAHLSDADVVVAATGDDEDNLVTSLLAKQEFDVPRVLARVNHPGNEWLFNEQWGVDQAVSPPHMLTAMVETKLTTVSPATGKALYELRLPPDSTIVAVLREGHVVIPQPETVLAAGDELVALAAPESELTLREAIVGD